MKEKDKIEIEEFNVQHDEDGLFSNEKDAECESSYFVDKKRSSKKVSLKDKDQSGRGKRKSGQGKYRCKDNTPKWESMYREYINEKEESVHSQAVEVPTDMYDCAKQRQEDALLMKRLKKAVVDAKKSGQKTCPFSYEDAVKIINQLEKATKGKAFEV